MNKKAQTEMIGLAIIVMIMLVGMVFAMKFLVKNPEIRSELSDKQIGIAFLNTLLSDKLEVDECKGGVELKEMIQDCSSEIPNHCGDGTTYCDKAKEVAATIFRDSFEEREKPYLFRVMQVDTHDKPCTDSFLKKMIELPETTLHKCSEGTDRVLVNYPLPTDYGTIFVCLNICSGPNS